RSTPLLTTQISTLSLHDALPIYPNQEQQNPAAKHPLQSLGAPSALNGFGERKNHRDADHENEERKDQVVKVEACPFGVFQLVGQDRKSTRLNSSHEWSSYAVFCL